MGRIARNRTGAIFIAVLIVVCGLSTVVGIAAPLGSFGHDTLFLLDNAYRVIQGQVPHRDFSSAWGPIIFLIYAVGLALSGMRPSGLGYANALFGATAAIWAFLIIRPRYSSATASALGIYTILLIVAPFSIGNNPFDFGYAMVYNRYGYALFGIIMMECAAYAATTHTGTQQGMNGAVSTGVALGLLAFLKISYALVALGFIVVTTIGIDPGCVRRLIQLFGGFAIVAVLVLSYLRFDLSDMFRDLATAAAARRLDLMWRPLGIVDWVQIVSMFLFAGLSYRGVRPRQALFKLMSVASGYALLVSNMRMSTLPLNAYAAAALAARDEPFAKPDFPKWLAVSPHFPRVLMLIVCFLPFFIQNVMSLTGAALERQWPTVPNVISPDSPRRGTDLVFRPVTSRTETTGTEYVKALNDGMELIRRHSDHDGVLTFDEFNPFNYLLDRPSPRGGFAAAAYNYIFSKAAHPTAERFFGNAPYVMVRKYQQGGPDVWEAATVSELMRIYGAALRSQFTVVEETEHWVLWHRNSTSP